MAPSHLTHLLFGELRSPSRLLVCRGGTTPRTSRCALRAQGGRAWRKAVVLRPRRSRFARGAVVLRAGRSCFARGAVGLRPQWVQAGVRDAKALRMRAVTADGSWKSSRQVKWTTL